ncbi:type II secretion system protein GspD [Aequorivita sp. CIP111184]|uniref:type II secretion system protein GspD n=1 Tax=Aequorivita sp. CIP111184 TaxID=2211356 RepID=UPI000DBBD7D4|nr:general secretion pathway protein GspD [Aequorivita sp. CIP111184]SRX52227.1 Type IV pilus biogenesis and competence protein PilQ [Aequorivita sp. CIP111184]
MRKILLSLLLLFFFLGTGFAQDENRINFIRNQFEVLKLDAPGLEETININITQTTLSNFLLAIAKVHSLNINVSPELSSISIVNNFSNVMVGDVLIFLVKEYQLDIDFTGNILSIKKYVEPQKEIREKEINASYSLANSNLSLDLKNDRLDKVFRKIMDISGKNLLYSPEIESSSLSIYIKDVPFDLAMEKLAESNNLLFSKSRDGFYVFDSAYDSSNGGNTSTGNTRPVRRGKTNFYYTITDTLARKVTVDLQRTPIADVIYTIGDDLKLDIFTASPLDNAGATTVKAENISFDLLLDKIFESSISSQNGNQGGNNPSNNAQNFTYTKDGKVYYFGTENQLSLKQTELVPMMYRSVQMLSNPSGSGQRRILGNTSGVNPANNQNQTQNYGSNNKGFASSSSNSSLSSIEDILPDDIKDGIDIKIDKELNSFVVSGPGVKVEKFKGFIKYIDKPVPVILIEVMILEVNRSAIVETGISFGLGDKPTTTQGSVFPSADLRLGANTVNKIIGNFDGFGSLNLGNVLPNFYLDIKAMESNGKIKVLSTPKLSTLNGHKAYLSSGQTTYYAVTTQSFYGSQIPQTSEIKNYVPIDAQLALEIMPIVAGDGEITLDIQVIQSTFNGERVAEDAPPGINSREFSSIIRMREQDVAILGGIEEVRKDDSGSGVPLLARIPIIKWIFSKKRREDSNRKLNILIKPTVIY